MNRYDEQVQRLHGVPFLGQSFLSEEQLSALETAIGNALPTDYREFLRNYGGYAFSNLLLLDLDQDGATEGGGAFTSPYDALTFYTIAPDEPLNIMDWYELYHESELIPAALFPIASLDEDQCCLMMGGEGQGSICLWSLRQTDARLLSPSFDAFIKSLTHDDTLYPDEM